MMKIVNYLLYRNKCAYLLESSETSITIWRQEYPKIAIFRICYGEKGTVKFFEILADNVFRHNYSTNEISSISEYPVWR
jgi:hypothetical protein